MRFTPRQLFWPLIVSLSLHAGIGLLPTLKNAPPSNRGIDVDLPRLVETVPAEQLLKNTYKNEAISNPNQTASIAPQPLSARSKLKQTQVSQQRLSAHVFYPPQAVAQGLEGEVRLLLRLDAKGKLLEARVASSSGQSLLDNAAVAAAYATGVFPGGATELMLPVVFRLSE